MNFRLLIACHCTSPAEKHSVAAEHNDLVKALSAKVEAWVATLPKDYVKTGDKDN